MHQMGAVDFFIKYSNNKVLMAVSCQWMNNSGLIYSFLSVKPKSSLSFLKKV